MLKIIMIPNNSSLTDIKHLSDTDWQGFKIEYNSKEEKYCQDPKSMEKDYKSVNKYTLKIECVKSYDIFRLKESKVAIFISERFRQDQSNSQIIGCDFLPVGMM